MRSSAPASIPVLAPTFAAARVRVPMSGPRAEPGAVSAVLAIARMTVLEAARGRFAWLVAGYALAGCVLAAFVAEVAITETESFRSGLLGAWLRWCAVFTVTAFVVSSVSSEIRDKGLDLVLSMAVPRAVYYAGKLAGLAAVAALSAGACALALVWFAPPAQTALWATSLALELLVVTAMALLCVLTFSQIAWAMSTVLGFYVLARSTTALQLMAHEPAAVPASAARSFVRAFVDALAHLLPDLDRFTESEWLIYGDGTAADLEFAAVQTAVYTVLLGAAALFDLYRRAL